MYCCVFLNTANSKDAAQVLYKFGLGVARSTPGLDEVAVSTKTTYEDCDVAVIFGSWKDRDQPWHNLKRDIVAKAKKFIVIETPLIGRGPVTEQLKDKWYRIGINGLLADTADFNNNSPKLPDTRWKLMQQELSVSLEPWKNNSKDGHCLVVLQLPEDASLNGINITEWAYSQAKLLRLHTNKPIIVRKPQIVRKFDEEYMDRLSKIDGLTFQEGTKENLKDTIDNSFRVSTYSSGLGIESVMAGIPTYAYSPSSFVYRYMPKEPDYMNINHPITFKIDRDKWIRKLSFCQWSYDEVRKGLPWCHLREKL